MSLGPPSTPPQIKEKIQDPRMEGYIEKNDT